MGAGSSSRRKEAISMDTQGVGEKSVFTDHKTGQTFWRITNSVREDRHTYYDLCPWSPDGRYIVFSSASSADLTTPGANIMTTRKGRVCVLDEESYTRKELAFDTFYQTHNGTPAVWSPTGRRIYFQKTEGTPGGADGTVGVIDVQRGTIEREMTGPLWWALWWLSPDGQRFVFSVDEPTQLEGRGMYTMMEDGSDVRLAVSTEELYTLSPYREKFAAEDVHVGIGKWSPDGKYFLFLMWVSDRGTSKYVSPAGVQPSLFVASRDGREKWWVGYTGHHQSFTPDSKRIIWAGWKNVSPNSRPGARDGNVENRDPRIFLANIDGSHPQVLVEEPYGGHPTMDPTCRWVVTFDSHCIVLVNVAKGTVEKLRVFEPAFDQSHSGTHPHCVWNRDGTRILYNSAESGHSQLHVIPIEERGGTR
jgi:Tol biopolymer transport system component